MVWTPAPDPTLRLADHVRACAFDDVTILLDLQRSRYASISAHHWQILGTVADLDPNANAPARGSTGPSSEPAARQLAEPLLRQGLLTTSPRLHARPHLRLAEPRSTLDPAATGGFPGIGLTARFLMAAAGSAWWLRWRSLLQIAQRVQDRHPRTEAVTGPRRRERLAAAVAAFDTLRPLVFTARERCLFDSIALVCFLAREGLATRWVIGVATHPFRAHSWVQDGDTVLNDLHEHVRGFRPILAV